MEVRYDLLLLASFQVFLYNVIFNFWLDIVYFLAEILHLNIVLHFRFEIKFVFKSRPIFVKNKNLSLSFLQLLSDTSTALEKIFRCLFKQIVYFVNL